MRPALRFEIPSSCSSRNASCSCSGKSESSFIRGRNDYSKSWTTSSSSSARRNTTRRRRRKKCSSSSSSTESDDEKKKSEENSLARVGIETRMKNASVGALAALTLSLGGNPTMMMMTPSTSVAYASTGNGIENTAKRTGDCLLQNCKAELAGCLADEKCVESLACLNVCFGKPDEADCQIRCGDLYASPAVQKFNTCAVTRNACVAQRQSTGEYPVPDFDAIETKENVTIDDWTKKKRWYIVAGLNKDFDIFDCQEHFFAKGDDDKMYIKINWRVNRPNGQFYERGDVQRFYQEDDKAIFLNRGNPETKLHYQDDWIIPKDGFYADEEKGVAFVYYRGTNDAWDGYGGAVVYATEPTLRPEFIPRMKAAAEKVNVDWNKMVITDNSCKAPEEVKVTNIADLDTLGDDVKAVEKVVERDVEKITEKLVGKDVEKILESDITKIEKALGSEIKALESNLFRLEQATEQKIAGPQRAFGNEGGKNDVGFDINLKKAEKKLVEIEKEVRRIDPDTNGFAYYPAPERK